MVYWKPRFGPVQVCVSYYYMGKNAVALLSIAQG